MANHISYSVAGSMTLESPLVAGSMTLGSSPTNIFNHHSESSDDNLNTKTDILKTIPEEKVTVQVKDWQKIFKWEWRWRFMRFRNKTVAEISKQYYNNNDRYYFDLNTFVKRDISPIYDDYVTETYYVYTN
jgi:hypothetical protein